MYRNFSFSDLRLIPAISKYNEIALLSPKLDPLVNSCLEKLGFDITQAIQYIPSKHRNMQGKVVIGFQAVGTISTDRKFLNSKLCSSIDRLVAASRTDMSLTKELAKLMGSNIQLRDDGAIDEDGEWPVELIEEDYEDVSKRIKQLESLRDQIRGSMFNDKGALKLPSEYQN